MKRGRWQSWIAFCGHEHAIAWWALARTVGAELCRGLPPGEMMHLRAIAPEKALALILDRRNASDAGVSREAPMEASR